MPTVRMPNGDQVRFPDDMPAEQIRAMILKKFPYADRGSPLPAQGAITGTAEVPSSTAGDIGYGLMQGLAKPLVGLSKISGDPLAMTAAGGAVEQRDPRLAQARQQATEQLQRFTDEPSQSWAQTGGRLAGETAPFFIPGPDVGAAAGEAAAGAATRMLPRVAPVVRGAAGRYAANPAYAARQALSSRLGSAGSTLGDVVERAAMSAGVGALEDPNSERGAIAGALGSGVGPAGARLVSGPGGWLAGRLGQGATLYGGHALGLPLWEELIGAWPLSRVVRGAMTTPTRGALRSAARAPGLTGATAVQAAQAIGGNDASQQNGQPRSPQRQPAPLQPGGPAARSAGSGRQRDNNAATDQRADRRWQDPDYFPETEGSRP